MSHSIRAYAMILNDMNNYYYSIPPYTSLCTAEEMIITNTNFQTRQAQLDIMLGMCTVIKTTNMINS